jgi:hypothetical protein
MLMILFSIAMSGIVSVMIFILTKNPFIGNFYFKK